MAARASSSSPPPATPASRAAARHPGRRSLRDRRRRVATRANTVDPADDRVADFSSRSRCRAPDVVAPGHELVSLRVPGSALDREFPGARVGGDVLPRQRHLAGRRRPSGLVGPAARRHGRELTPDQVKALLMHGAVDLPDPREADGAGRVDLRAHARAADAGRRRGRAALGAGGARPRKLAPRAATTTTTDLGPARRVDRSPLVRPPLVGPPLVWSDVDRLGRLTRVTLGALIAATAVAAIVLWLGSSATSCRTRPRSRIPWWALAAGFAIDRGVRDPRARARERALAVAVRGPAGARPAAGRAERSRARDGRRPGGRAPRSRAGRPVRLFFNLAQFALTAALATITLHALAPAPAAIGPAVWGATFAAVFAASADRRRCSSSARSGSSEGGDPVAQAGRHAGRRPRGRAHEHERRAVGRHRRRA